MSVSIALALVIYMTGCKCGDTKALAELTETKGSIERDWAANLKKWEKAAVGADFYLGDGVRSHKASEAILKLMDGSYVRLTPESLIRFLDNIPGDKGKNTQGIDVQAGLAELTVGSSELVLFTSVGMAKLQSGTKITIRSAQDALEFKVEIGEATFFDKNNKPNVVTEGDEIAISIGAAILERGVAQSPATDTAKPKDKEEVQANEVAEEAVEHVETEEEEKNLDVTPPAASGGGGSGTVEIGEGPKEADFAASAGDSFIVHVSKPPISVALNLGDKCSNGAAIQIGRKYVSKGTSSANVLFSKGRKRYRVKCLNKDGMPEKDVVAKGSVLVLRDSGVSKLPLAAPSSLVETDGRRYKIMYQNRLPNIKLKWPQGPKGQTYKLHMETAEGKKKVITTKTPDHVLKSGKLKEGVHRIKYQAIGNLSRTSKVTTIEISFDNAAPKASLSEPKNRSFDSGSSVKVSGVAAPGWKVSHNGKPLTMDSKLRFAEGITHSAKFRSIALRLYHPKRGVHYYLRRAKGSTQ